RLQRYHRWTLLWLRWFAAFLEAANAFLPFTAQARAAAHQWLDKIELIVIKIAFLRAWARRPMWSPPKHPARRRNDAQIWRAARRRITGNSLRAKALTQRIAALSQSIDRLVARAFRRLPLTRRRPFITRPEAGAVERDATIVRRTQSADTS